MDDVVAAAVPRPHEVQHPDGEDCQPPHLHDKHSHNGKFKGNQYGQDNFSPYIYKILYRLNSTLQRKSHLCIPRKGIVQPQSQFPHSCVCEQFINSQDRSTYFPTAE